MTRRHYYFRSNWHIDAPLEKVWQVMTAIPFMWDQWWPQLQDLHNVRLGNGLEGSRFSCSWQAPLGYRLKTDILICEVRDKQRVRLITSGDLDGEVVCLLREQGSQTVIDIDWQVSTTKAWMNRTYYLLKPFFIWSHHAVMRGGERGLRQQLSQ